MAGPVLGKAYIEIEPDVSGFGKKLSGEISKATSSTSSGMSQVSGTVTKGLSGMSTGLTSFLGGFTGALLPGLISGLSQVGQALVDFGAEAIQMGVDASESASAFGTVFGESAGDLQAFVDEFANAAGLTEAELQGLLATTGNVIKGIGGTTDEAADLGETLARTAADVASFTNAEGGAEAVLSAFQSALTGERDALKTYGIVISEAEVQQRALNDTGKKTVDQLTRIETAAATTALIIERAGDAIGDLDRTSDGAANTQRRLQARFKELQTSIGQQLLPVWSDVLEAVEDALPAIEDVGTGFANFATTTLPVLVEALTTATEAFSTFLGVATVDVQSEFARSSTVVGELIEKYGALDKNLAILIEREQRAVASGSEWGSNLELNSTTLDNLNSQLKVSDEEWGQFLQTMLDNRDALGLSWVEVRAVNEALAENQSVMGSANEDARDFAVAQGILAGETGKSGDAAGDATPKVDGLAGSHRAAAREARLQRDALRELSDVYLAQISPIFAAQQAQTDFNEALAAVEEGGKATGKELDALNEATARKVAADLEVTALGPEVTETIESNRRAMKLYGADQDTASAASDRLHDKQKAINDQDVVARINVGEIDDAIDKSKGLEDNLKRIDQGDYQVDIGVNTTFRTIGTPSGVGSKPVIGHTGGQVVETGIHYLAKGEEIIPQHQVTQAGLLIAAVSDLASQFDSVGVGGRGGITVANTFNAPVGGSMSAFADEVLTQGALELRLARA